MPEFSSTKSAMTQAIDCRYAQFDGHGAVRCRSTLVPLPRPGQWPIFKATKCDTCPVRDKIHDSPRREIKLDGRPLQQIYHELCLAMTSTEPGKNDRSYGCIHRGEVVRTIRKNVCCGRHADFKVFKCPVRGECTLETELGPVVCKTCGDRSTVA